MNALQYILFVVLSPTFLLGNIELPAYFGIDFNKSMQHTSRYTLQLLNQPSWKKAKQLYDAIVAQPAISSEPRIPKIIHQVWLGSQFPEKYKYWQQSWIKHHPDWEYKLWTDADIAEFGLINQKLYNTETNWAAKSDIARYEILYRIGGLYVDTDFECFTSFDFLHHLCDFYGGLNCGPEFQVQNCIIASRPGHPILEICIKDLQSEAKLKDRNNGAMQILYRTGPFFLTQCVEKYFPRCNDATVLLPTSYFFPIPYFSRDSRLSAWKKPESMGAHYWNMSWSKSRGN